MTEEAQMCIDLAKDSMEESLKHHEKSLKKVRAGKANPTMLDSIQIESYGARMPLAQVSNISVPDPRTLTIAPWDKSNLILIENEIRNSNLGFNPQNNGEMIIINVPVLTEERRNDLVKKVRVETEDSKISIRNVRRTANEEAKQMEKDGLSEDECKRLQDSIQSLTDDYTKKIESISDAKESEILKV